MAQNVRTFPETLSKMETYQLLHNAGVKKLTEELGDNGSFKIKAAARYTDQDNEGTEKEVLVIVTPEGDSYATISPTVIRNFDEIEEIFGEEIHNLTYTCEGRTSTGKKRTYYILSAHLEFIAISK